MQLVKKTQHRLYKSPDFAEQYTSENTSRAPNSSRLNDQPQKRFKRNKNNNNHSKSSSNCSQSSSISKFYVKNITSFLPCELLKNQNSVKSPPAKQSDRKELRSPKPSVRVAFNSYGLSKENCVQNKQEDKRQESGIDVTNFLKRQFSPPLNPKLQQVAKKSKNGTKGVNGIEDCYNFLSPTSKKLFPVDETKISKDPKMILDQLTKQRNKNAETCLQLEKCKNNQKKLHLLNEQLDLKAKRLAERINTLQQQLNKSAMNNAKLKQENHRMKVLVKQRDSLMSSLMERQKTGKKECSKGNSPGHQNESIVSKVIEYEYQNQKLRDTIYKLKKQVQDLEFQSSGSKLMLQPSQLQSYSSMSEIGWDDKQFTDCLEQKDREIVELREEIKNLQIQINYINRKWANEVERVKKIQKLEWMKLKDKYKELLLKYKDNMKVSFVFPPSRQEVNKQWKDKKRAENETRGQNPQNITIANPEHQSPRKRKRNYTVDHLKGRGIMSDIKINYGPTSKIGNPYQQATDLQLLQYSSCDDQMGY